MTEAAVDTGTTTKQDQGKKGVDFDGYQAMRQGLMEGKPPADTTGEDAGGKKPDNVSDGNGEGTDTKAGGELDPGSEGTEANKKKVFSVEDVNRITQSRIQRDRRQRDKEDPAPQTQDKPKGEGEVVDANAGKPKPPTQEVIDAWEAKEPKDDIGEGKTYKSVDDWYDKWTEWYEAKPGAQAPDPDKPAGKQPAGDDGKPKEVQDVPKGEQTAVDPELQPRVDDLVMTLQRDVKSAVIGKDVEAEFWNGLKDNDIHMSFPMLRFLNDHSEDETTSLLIQQFVQHPSKARRIAKMGSDYEVGKAMRTLAAAAKPKPKAGDKPRDRKTDTAPVDLDPIGGGGNEPAKQVHVTDFKAYSKLRGTLIGEK